MNSQMAGAELWTTISLVLMGVGAVLAVMMILWGARKKRQRSRADSELEDRASEDAATSADRRVTEAKAAPTVATPTLDDHPPRAPETDPVPVVAPVAPPPPPLADTPVVATPAVEPAPLPTPAASDGADNLTRMKGVGPKLAARLNELGITRFEQVASLDDDGVAALDAQLGTFQGRIVRDRWVEQAGYLARDDRAGFEAAFGKL